MDGSARRPRFSPAALLGQLRRLPACARYWVAYSGGCDSHVLLHALAAQREALGAELGAVHVDHGLQAVSAGWAAHCAAICAALDVPYVSFRVNARPGAGESPEAAARRARYAALASFLRPGDGVVLAHHQDDQAETVLLQLLRGGGPHGLAAMTASAALGDGLMLRPMIAFERADVLDYARTAQLQWVEDPTNGDVSIRRNFLRHEIFPRLAPDWPAAARGLARSASHLAEAAELMDALARIDLTAVQSDGPERLRVGALLELDPARRRNVLRHWLRGLGLPVPEAVHLDQILDSALAPTSDTGALVHWPGAEVRRHRGELFAMPPLAAPDAEWSRAWDLGAPLDLPDGGRLRAEPATGEGLSVRITQAGVRVGYRKGGERCRPSPTGHSRELKKMLQESGIPPWVRNRIPVITAGDEVAAVAGLWYCGPWRAGAGEPGLRVVWEPVGG